MSSLISSWASLAEAWDSKEVSVGAEVSAVAVVAVPVKDQQEETLLVKIQSEQIKSLRSLLKGLFLALLQFEARKIPSRGKSQARIATHCTIEVRKTTISECKISLQRLSSFFRVDSQAPFIANCIDAMLYLLYFGRRSLQRMASLGIEET